MIARKVVKSPPLSPSPLHLQFELKEIPLSILMPMIQAGSGNYSELKEELLTEIPKLEARNAANGKEPQGFSFALPGTEEVPETQRRGICLAINLTLRKAGLRWRSTYSNKARMFLVAPHMAGTPNPGLGVDRSEALQEFREKVLELRSTGLTLRAIAAKLGVKVGRVNYAVFGDYDRTLQRAKKTSKNHDDVLNNLVETACTVLETTKENLTRKRSHSPVRPAIMKIAYEKYGIQDGVIASFFGLGRSGARMSRAHAKPNIVNKLLTALSKENRGGGRDKCIDPLERLCSIGTAVVKLKS